MKCPECGAQTCKHALEEMEDRAAGVLALEETVCALRSRAEAAEKERDLAREVVESTTREAGTAIHAAESERDALRDQIEHEGCATSHLGERTYSCRAESLCGLCRLRLERDAARAEADRQHTLYVDAAEDRDRARRERDAALAEVARLRGALRGWLSMHDRRCTKFSGGCCAECEGARRALTPGETR